VNVSARKRFSCAAALVVAGLVSGCSHASPADAAFVKRANKVCAPAAAMLDKKQFPFSSFDPEHPKSADLPKVGKFFAALYPEFARTVEELNALTPSPGLASKWKSFGILLVAKRANTAAQDKDAEQSNVPAFLKTVKNAESLTARIKKLGHEIGFEDSSTCFDVLI